MGIRTEMTPDASFFAVFCIEALADRLGISGNEVYKMLVDESSILDSYLIPGYDCLHTQGKEYIVDDLLALMKQEGVLK